MNGVDVQGDVEAAAVLAALDARIARAARAAAAAVADQASAHVHTLLEERIRHPTPYYWTQITRTSQGPWEIVHDRGVAYGPWLEDGTGRGRTRFRGYHAWAETRAWADGAAGYAIASAEVAADIQGEL